MQRKNSAKYLAALCLLVFWQPAMAQTEDTAKNLTPVARSGPLAGKAIYANSYALLIGVNEYPHLAKDKWLEYAVQDVTKLRDVLISSYGFPAENITSLTNADATKANITKALSRFSDKRKINADDRILIYFSGHGQTVALPSGGDMGFLLPSDADVDLSDLDNAGPFLDTCLGMNAIWNYLQSSPAKHVLVMADACYSGLMTRPRALTISKVALAALASRRATQVITAGRKGEETFENPKLGHGAFTYELIEELKARASTPGEVFTTSDLYSKLETSVADVTDGKQTPQMGNYNTEGEFLFITTPSVSVQTPTESPAEHQFKLGEALRKQKKYKAAEPFHREAVRLEPTNAEYQNYLGYDLDYQGQYVDAEVFVREAVRLEPTNAKYQVNVGILLEEQKKYIDAEPFLREAIRLEPTNAQYQNELGIALDHQGKYIEAEPFYREAIRLEPTSARYQRNLGSALNNQAKYAEAEPFCREAIRLDAKNAFGQDELGVALYGQAKYVEAESFYREAVRIEPTDAGYQDNLGSALYMQGKYRDAEPFYREAVRLDPTNDQYKTHLDNCLKQIH